MQLRLRKTDKLDLWFEEGGSPRGFPVVFAHGFPDDPRAVFDAILKVADLGSSATS